MANEYHEQSGRAQFRERAQHEQPGTNRQIAHRRRLTIHRHALYADLGRQSSGSILRQIRSTSAHITVQKTLRTTRYLQYANTNEKQMEYPNSKKGRPASHRIEFV